MEAHAATAHGAPLHPAVMVPPAGADQDPHDALKAKFRRIRATLKMLQTSTNCARVRRLALALLAERHAR